MIILAFLFPLLVNAELLDDNITKESNESVTETIHSYEKVCATLKKPIKPITVVPRLRLKCGSEIIQVGEYCNMVSKNDPFYIMGLIRWDKNQVVCRSAKKVTFYYQCKKTNNISICKDRDAERACEVVQKERAYNLDLVSSKFIIHPVTKFAELQCEFDKLPLQETKDENEASL